MSYGDNTNSGIKLKGDLLIAELGANFAFNGWEDPANISEFMLDPGSGEVGKHIGRGINNEGQILSAWVDPGQPLIKFSIDSLPVVQLSLAMRGSLGIINQGAGSVTDEPVTLFEGKWIDLGYKNLVAESFALTGVGGTPPLVEGVDFEVQYQFGMLKALNAGAAGPQEADFDHAAVSGSVVYGANQAQLSVALQLNGSNKTNGRSARVAVERGIMMVTTELALLGGQDVVTMAAEVHPLLAPGASGSFTYEEWT